jgi:hypothetical protein
MGVFQNLVPSVARIVMCLMDHVLEKKEVDLQVGMVDGHVSFLFSLQLASCGFYSAFSIQILIASLLAS